MSIEIFTDMNAVHADIIAAIEATGIASADEYNIDAIARECYEYDPAHGHIQDAGFICTADVDEFWASVERHAK
ncbi:hypothetical protein OS125_11235 [Corynebacterium sp. P7003]|uniref:Phage protein n=1 Tax=Corynebacterium pygosceleis TaxID=2800406 RepID=A0ABT3WX59_9CORY|nr:hypothetical protein [Corynebacterium pygosceleis]MCX7445805.1 hypothetical protein [Corynebacterium pygosceleis]